MPRQSIGTTFVVSMSILGLLAALQVFAVIWRYAEPISQQVKNSALAAQATPAPAPAEQAAPIRPAPPAVSGQQVQELLVEADSKFRIGDFDAAMKVLDKVEALSPNDPKVLISKALVLEKMNQPAEAILQLEALLRVPGLPAADRASVAKKIDLLAESLGGSGAPMTGGGSRAEAGEAGSEMRGDNGIRPGATLGIVDVRVKDSPRGSKILGVAVKSLPGVEVNGDKVKILAYFYEKTEDGAIELTESKIVAQWMSPPIDWAENEPELLDLQYTLPGSDAEGLPGRTYAGYVVGLYYNGELQDFRSDPASLAKQYPLPLDDPQ
jgi:tetratricopeptide (TPR) repeat protein